MGGQRAQRGAVAGGCAGLPGHWLLPEPKHAWGGSMPASSLLTLHPLYAPRLLTLPLWPIPPHTSFPSHTPLTPHPQCLLQVCPPLLHTAGDGVHLGRGLGEGDLRGGSRGSTIGEQGQYRQEVRATPPESSKSVAQWIVLPPHHSI